MPIQKRPWKILEYFFSSKKYSEFFLHVDVTIAHFTIRNCNILGVAYATEGPSMPFVFQVGTHFTMQIHFPLL